MELRDLPIASTLGFDLDEFAATCEQTDGTAPFNDASLLRPEQRRALVHRDDRGDLIALALINLAADEAEFAVHPDHRRQGHGRQLIEQLCSAGSSLTYWAHGNLPGARALAERVGATPVRTLYVLARATHPNDAEPGPAPDGIRVRTFEPDRDAHAWVALNATIFADHPEQGKLTFEDLQARMRQSWFNATDFFVATSTTEPDELIGYCWCKLTDEAAEIYVIGTHPDAAGRGIARALMARALAHLEARGAEESILYVDGDNERALSLYRRMGYGERFIDVQYRESAGDNAR